VEIVADSDPIVCKIMDYGKHLFEIKKTKAAAKKKTAPKKAVATPAKKKVVAVAKTKQKKNSK
jgi:translation initiation factor IF-3